MLVNGVFRRAFLAFLLLGISLSNSALAESPKPNTRISDVALGKGGRLEGQVVDYQGNTVSNASISLKSEGIQPIATTTTDDGRFAYEGLSGGVYQVASKNGDYATVRAWTQEAAPPNAQAQAVLYTQNVNPPPQTMNMPNGPVSQGMTPRGGLLKGILANPIVLPAAIATAIAVPVALNAHRSPASP